jgi:NTE family protein
MKQRVALILTGGGARAAYQVGVLKAISEFLPKRARNPFPVICGTSAGALNAATLAVNAKSFRKGVQYLLNTWKNFHASQVYRTDVAGVFNNTVLWVAGVFFSAIGISKLKQVSLLDNAPLVELLDELLPCEKIQESIDSGHLHALSVTASGYGTGESVTFYQGAKEIEPWHRTGRVGIPTQIEIKHLLASAALPFIFPATLINREYFGDGSMRQITPIGSALNLGATRVLVIGVTANSYGNHAEREDIAEYPSLAKIAGHALNSIFLDSMATDLERVRRINSLVAMMTEEVRDRKSVV